MRKWAAALALAMALPATAAVDVASRATGGSGTAANPWTGWDTAFEWTANTEYLFRSGHFRYGRSPDLVKPGIALIGEAGATLRFAGTGDALTVDSVTPVENVRIENLIIQGTRETRNGVFLRGVNNAVLRHVSVRDVANAGVWLEVATGGLLENVRVTHHEMPDDRFAVVPDYGLVFSSQARNLRVVNPVIEGLGKAGIWLQRGSESNTLINGTSEGNPGKGIVIDGNRNTIINTDFEWNGEGQDIEISGDENELRAIMSVNFVEVKSGRSNKIRGRFYRMRISGACMFTDISGVYTFVLEDSSPTTIKYGYQTYDGYQRGLRPGRGP